jgi:hypothetical protein
MRSNSKSTGNGIDRSSITSTANGINIDNSRSKSIRNGGISRDRLFFTVFSVLSVLFVQRQLFVPMKYYNNFVINGDYNNIKMNNKRMMNEPTAVIRYDNQNQDRNNILEVNNSLLFAARPHPMSPYYPLPTIGIHDDIGIGIGIGIDVTNKTIINVTSIADSANKTASSNSSSRINNLVVMVMTRNDSFERRQIIRSTWAKTAVKKKKEKQQQPSSSSSLDNNNSAYSEKNKININDESRQPLVYFVVGDFCKIPPKYRENDSGENPLCKVRDGELDPYIYSIEQEKYVHDVIIPNENKLRNEQNIHGDILIMDGPEVYSNLPKKLKAAYTFVDRYLPKSIRYIAKVDDDVFVRLNAFQNYIDVTFENNNNNSTNNNNNDPQQQQQQQPPIVAGDVRSGLGAATGGKWKEVSQFEPFGIYPTFPIGSAGHLVSRPIAEYISQYQDSLFDYQGEDVSLGIWVNTMNTNRGNTNAGSGAKTVQQQQQVQYEKIYGMKTMVKKRYCKNQSALVVGHDFNDTLLKKCQSFWDNKKKEKQKQKQ